jgi:hypothetical protein
LVSADRKRRPRMGARLPLQLVAVGKEPLMASNGHN